MQFQILGFWCVEEGKGRKIKYGSYKLWVRQILRLLVDVPSKAAVMFGQTVTGTRHLMTSPVRTETGILASRQQRYMRSMHHIEYEATIHLIPSSQHIRYPPETSFISPWRSTFYLSTTQQGQSLCTTKSPYKQSQNRRRISERRKAVNEEPGLQCLRCLPAGI